ncbi:MAG: hypothetical protein ABH871_08770 [Pseudomonadota bacterium]
MSKIGERVAIIGLILAVVLIVSFLVRYERKLNKQVVMYYQLQAIRTSINLFKAMEHRNPASLKELVTSTYEFPQENQKRHYLENPLVNENGKLLDPFANAYEYDAKTAWVRSSTPGYFYW